MAVNNNFYSTINELVARATNGTTTAVVDYSTFIDAGKAITAIEGADLQNGFVAALANKLALSINTARSYKGRYSELVLGSVTAGNTIEMIMNGFYSAQAAAFATLTDGQSVDQYTINKPTATAKYYTESNTFQIPVTIQRVELVKAFQSPEAMDSFIRGVTTYLMNSSELQRETGRIGLIASLIMDLNAETSVTDVNSAGQRYDLVSLYNQITSGTLTPDDALSNEGFVKFAVETIKKVMSKTECISESYNKDGIKTFTPPDSRHLFVNAALTSAMDTYIYTNNYNPEYSVLTNYINVPFWQDESLPLNVKAIAADGEETETTSAKVLAVLVDRYAVGEFVKQLDVSTTPYNARGQYWNEILNVELRYIRNDSANAVMFALA